jgi:RNase_H superfamily
MRRLAIDIETSPMLADVWGIWQQNVSLNQLRENARVLCFAAQWEGEHRVTFASEWGDGPDMIRQAHELLDEADEVIHYNGIRFDVPHLNREMLLGGYDPPSPFKSVDLLREVKSAFSFPSYKLEYVSQVLGVGEKMKHSGHELWVRVMAGDRLARAEMRRYNTQDTRLLFPLYYKLRPWISTPNAALGTGEDVCPACGSDSLRREGYANLISGRYQRFQCESCGKWSRSSKRDSGVQIVPVAR